MTDRNGPDRAGTGIPDAEEALPPFFSARLTPHRSLGQAGFLILMVFVGGVSFVTGIFFVTLGAWPVLGFFGLDVLAVFLAFRWSYRSARAYEEIHVGRDLVLIRRIDPRGRMQEYRFNPLWLRLEVERHAEAGTTAIRLCGRGRRLIVGSFLNPSDKESFATAFSAALSAARSGNVPA